MSQGPLASTTANIRAASREAWKPRDPFSSTANRTATFAWKLSHGIRIAGFPQSVDTHSVNRLFDGLLGITAPLLRIATGFAATTLSVLTLLRRAVIPSQGKERIIAVLFSRVLRRTPTETGLHFFKITAQETASGHLSAEAPPCQVAGRQRIIRQSNGEREEKKTFQQKLPHYKAL